MAQESSGLKLDDERPEVRDGSDRDAGLSNTTTTQVDARDDGGRTGLSVVDSVNDTDTVEIDDSDTEDTDQLRQEIEETRASMGQTIDAIQERLSISNISDQVSEQVSNAVETAKDAVYEATLGKVAQFMKETGKSISRSNIGHTISANPWPFALIGLGSAWLIYSSVNGGKRRTYMGSGNRGTRFGERNYLRSHESGQSESGGVLSGATETASNAASSVASTASGALNSVTSTAGSALRGVTSTASSTVNKASDVANRAYERVGEYGHVAQEKYEEYIETKPLAVAAAAAAVGAAIGFAIPSTNYEGQLVGEHRDQLMSKASDAATQLVDKAKEVAGEAGAVIKDELQSATETGSAGTGGGSMAGKSSTGTGRSGLGGGNGT